MTPETQMPADLYFALTLVIKMAVTAGVVVVATLAAERAGPLVAGLVATLPLGAGPVYVFLALDHGAAFIARSAVNSLAINVNNVIFALVYALLAQKRPLAVCLPVALTLWFALAFAVHLVNWTLTSAFLANVVVLGVCIVLARPLRHAPIPLVRTYWTDLALRAFLVAMLVGVVVSVSFQIGPAGSGILAVFPIILLSLVLILHRRIGGKPTAAILANGVLGLVGFGFACVVLRLTAVPLGAALGLILALCTSVAWGMGVLLARRHGVAV
jgi:hypothetical protein